ncbi:MAG TPA: hypothetical protein HPP87_04745 [Planctomycetes bacterium]|nr:hypothetical protein [Planctomycetota bacterium]
MMPQVEVKVNKAQLERVRRKFRRVPREVPGIMARAINRTARWGRGEIARKLSKKTGITQKYVRWGILLRKATRKKWQAELNLGPKSKIDVYIGKSGTHGIKVVSGKIRRHIPLIAFRARQTKRGVTYGIMGRRELVRSAFKQTMPHSYHKGIFIRRGKSRLPIDQVYGPTLGGLYAGAPGVARKVKAVASKRLTREIDSQVDYVLKRRAN